MLSEEGKKTVEKRIKKKKVWSRSSSVGREVNQSSQSSINLYSQNPVNVNGPKVRSRAVSSQLQIRQVSVCRPDQTAHSKRTKLSLCKLKVFQQPTVWSFDNSVTCTRNQVISQFWKCSSKVSSLKFVINLSTSSVNQCVDVQKKKKKRKISHLK